MFVIIIKKIRKNLRMCIKAIIFTLCFGWRELGGEHLRLQQIEKLSGPSNLPNYLIKRNVPYPHDWRRLSILEAGHKWESEYARVHHNFLGFNSCYFKSKEQCADFLKRWVEMVPPREGETFYEYLTRRRYNPNMKHYINLLSQIK